MNQIQNVFFDLDGTLVDPWQGITGCIRHALVSLGKTCPNENELRACIGPPIRVTFSRLLDTDESHLIEKAVALYRERYSPVGVFENEVYPGIEKMLADLNKRSCKLYVVTAKPKVYADIIVRHLSFNQWFAGVYGSELDGRFDDKAELIAFAMDTLKLQQDQTVMIGDRHSDVLAGKKNRVKTIGVTYGYGSRDEIAGSAPDFICHSPDEIQQIVVTS